MIFNHSSVGGTSPYQASNARAMAPSFAFLNFNQIRTRRLIQLALRQYCKLKMHDCTDVNFIPFKFSKGGGTKNGYRDESFSNKLLQSDDILQKDFKINGRKVILEVLLHS
jgi:hypothetical protein